ncbi:MAG TPA: ATP-binding protein [Flavobacteriaceae bacterium]
MNDVRYKWILYIIVIVILSTIGIQVYWNYKNYLSSKQQLINDVQVSLDKAVDDYYAHLAEKTTFGFTIESPTPIKFFDKNGKLDSIFDNFKNSSHKLDTSALNLINGKAIFKGQKLDTILNIGHRLNNPETNKSQIDVITYMESDSLHTAKFRTLTSKVIVSLTNDSLSLKEIDTLLKAELLRKNIHIDYSLNYKDYKDGTRTYNGFKAFNSLKRHLLKATSESTFLPSGSDLTINFTNETQIILKRIFGGILISFLLVLAVISSLFYLLHIIKHQKQLAEVKNDLISNITHEFKTPIATISVALESIKDFKIIEDKDKTKKYLELSGDQLSKLNVMVEKLLETATLDSDSLTLQKESIDIIEVLRTLVEKHQMLPIAIGTEHKTIVFSSPSGSIMASVDIFHFENAINNVLDNALKYGGKEIKVGIEQNSFAFTVSIIDNGNTITKAHKDKIFEKFYRIPKGNTHDVKGFGIGLYYTKKIVEKHGGTIHLNLEKNLTTFKLSFPNE